MTRPTFSVPAGFRAAVDHILALIAGVVFVAGVAAVATLAVAVLG